MTSERTTGDLLYRLYLVVLFGGFYGGALVHAIVTTTTPPPTPEQLVFAGLLAVGLPGLAGLTGVRFGRWAGPVPLTRAEADILLPTPTDRRRLLLPRLRWSSVAATLAGAGLGLVAVLLLALGSDVGRNAWWLVPALGGAGGLLGVSAAALAQTWPLTGTWHRRASAATALTALLPVLAAEPPAGRVLLQAAGAGVLGLDQWLFATSWLAGMTTIAVTLAVAGTVAVPRSHDEELRSRAGLHAGVLASARLGDVRAISQSREATSRRRALGTPPYPRAATGAIRWRQLVALRAHPTPVLRCSGAWLLATIAVTVPPDPLTGWAVTFRVLVAAGLLTIGVTPLLEPLRREHDSPLASELLPFGFAALTGLHLRAALGLTTLIGACSVLLLTLAPWVATPWWSITVVPVAAWAVVLTIADRVRQPDSLADVMATMPLGATPEVLGIAMATRLLLPLFAMLPIALPIGVAMAGPLLPVPVAGPVTATAALGLVWLLLRTLGLRLWLTEYERALQDAALLEPTSTIPIAWRRVRSSLRRARGRSGG